MANPINEEQVENRGRGHSQMSISTQGLVH